MEAPLDGYWSFAVAGDVEVIVGPAPQSPHIIAVHGDGVDRLLAPVLRHEVDARRIQLTRLNDVVLSQIEMQPGAVCKFGGIDFIRRPHRHAGE